MSEEMQNLKPGVKIVHLGQGKVVSNWGWHYGVPCVFLEPIAGEPGTVGEKVEEGREPQITNNSVSDGGLILVFHSADGARVVIDDILAAISKLEPAEGTTSV